MVFNKIVLMLSLVSLFNCQVVLNIKDAKIQKSISGLPKGINKTNISMNLVVNDFVNIKGIAFGKKEETIEDFTIYSIPDGLILKPTDTLSKGTYFIKAPISKKQKLNLGSDSKIFHLLYSNKGKQKTYTSKFEIIEDLLMK